MTNLQSVKYQENENFHVSDSLSKQKKKTKQNTHKNKISITIQRTMDILFSVQDVYVIVNMNYLQQIDFMIVHLQQCNFVLINQ